MNGDERLKEAVEENFEENYVRFCGLSSPVCIIPNWNCHLEKVV